MTAQVSPGAIIFTDDNYTLAAHTDDFSGAAIPISSVDSHTFAVQTNKITVAAGGVLNTGGSADLWTNDIGIASVIAQAKASSWASDAAGAILSLTGGNAATEFDGTAFSVAHAIVENDGEIHTGAHRNIAVTIDSFDPSTGALTGTGLDQISYTVGQQTDRSELLTTLGTIQTQLAEYQILHDKAPTDPTINAQIAFDQEEVTTIEGELLQQGLGEWHDPVTGAIVATPSSNSMFEPIFKSVQMIDIAPIVAQAGQIDIRADQLQGNGVFDAPTDISVSIVNHSIASLNIHGITIPQLTGGLYLNGAKLGDPLATDVKKNANDAINTSNKSQADTDNNTPMAKDSDNHALAVVGVANFTFLNSTLVPSSDPDAATLAPGQPQDVDPIITLLEDATQDPAAPPPEVDITGDVVAIEAHLFITTPGDINIQTKTVDVSKTFFKAAHSITISQVVLPVSGDPAGQIPGASTSLNSLVGSTVSTPFPSFPWFSINTPIPSDTQSSVDVITNYEKAQQQTVFHAEVITLEGEFVNINGLVQAGSEDNTLNIDQRAVDEIAQLKSEGKSRPTKLTSVSTDQFTVVWDPTVDQGDELQINDVRVAGGQISIKGKLFSTSQGELNALGNFGNITINNSTNYDLLVHNVDASQKGAGIIQIIDLNKTVVRNGTTYDQETTYQATSPTAMSMQTQYINPDADPASLAAVWVGPSGDSANPSISPVTVASNPDGNSLTTQYDPIKGARYSFSIASSTQTTITTTYYQSGWAGIINLGSGASVDSKTTTTSQPQVLASSLYYWVDANALTDPNYVTHPYTFSSATYQISDTGEKPGRNWTESTWYGKKTYYQEQIEKVGHQTISTHSIEADLPITIRMTGYGASNVTINSTGTGNVLLDGSVKSTGATTITSGGDIEQLSSSAIVTGAQVTLTAAGGIGTQKQLSGAPGAPPNFEIHPVDVVLTGGTGASLTATTTNGAIFVKAQGDLAVNSITAGGDQVVNLDVQGTLTATGTITGGSKILSAGGGIGTALAAIKLAGGQAIPDTVTVNAKGGSAYIDQTAGDLRLLTLTATGDAFIKVDAGNLVNVSNSTVQDDRTVAQLRSGAWSELALTGTAAQAKIQATLSEYQLYQGQQYKAYWKYAGQLVGGQVVLSAAEVTYYSGIYGSQADAQGLVGQAKTDFVANAISTLQLSETQQYFNLQAKFGVGGSYVNEFGNIVNNVGHYVKATGVFLYDPSSGPSGTDVATATYDPTKYDPNFVYLLTDNAAPATPPGEKQTLSAGIKVWTEDELINAIGAGLLKTVTSTDTNTFINIAAQKITLTVPSGNIGTINNPVTDQVGFSTKPVTLDPATQLALASAERSDLNFLTVAPVSATVNFAVDGNSVGSMTRTDGGTWSTSVFHVGDSLFIGGNSSNATEGGVYQVIDKISADGKTIYFFPARSSPRALRPTTRRSTRAMWSRFHPATTRPRAWSAIFMSTTEPAEPASTSRRPTTRTRAPGPMSVPRPLPAPARPSKRNSSAPSSPPRW